MRLVVALGATLALLLVAGTAAGSSAPAAKARVWVAAQRPVRVAGSGFRPGERVSVVVLAGTIRLRKTVSATVGGRLSAAWTASIAGGCHSTVVTATGAGGSSARYREVANDCGRVTGKL